MRTPASRQERCAINWIQLRRGVCFFVFTFAWIHATQAGEERTEATQSRHDPFSRGATEIDLLAGAFFSVDSGYPSRPTINFAAEKLRFGMMLSDPCGSGFLRGNAELLFEGLASQIFAGPGTTVYGASALLRYNLVHPQAWLVPYCQLGVGGAYNDIAHTESQALLGSEFQVLLQGDLGVRLLLNQRTSLTLESGLLHLSNAGTTERNHGLNCLGAQAGFVFSF